MATVHGIGKTLCVGSAMTLDHDAPQSEQHPRIGFLRVQLVAQRPERLPCKQIAELRAHGTRERRAQEIVDLSCRSLGGLERNIAAETFGYDDVGGSLANAIAFDEADIFKLGKVHRAQQLRGFANFLVALDFLDADIEQPDGWSLEVEHYARHGASHDRERNEVVGIPADGRTKVEHDRIAADRWPHGGNRRA